MRIDPEGDRMMVQAVGGRKARRPWMQLLSAVLGLAGGRGELLRHGERPWASITFSGTRHAIVIAFTGAEAVAAGEAFIAALPEHEFDIPRQIVADAAIVAVEHALLPETKLTVRWNCCCSKTHRAACQISESKSAHPEPVEVRSP
jgi:hypothetical protein